MACWHFGQTRLFKLVRLLSEVVDDPTDHLFDLAQGLVVGASEHLRHELLLQHRTLEQQAAQAGQDPMRLTPIRRQLEQNEQLLAAQKRVVADKQAERRRIDKRFDEELAKLQRLWEERSGMPAPGAASASR